MCALIEFKNVNKINMAGNFNELLLIKFNIPCVAFNFN